MLRPIKEEVLRPLKCGEQKMAEFSFYKLIAAMMFSANLELEMSSAPLIHTSCPRLQMIVASRCNARFTSPVVPG